MKIIGRLTAFFVFFIVCQFTSPSIWAADNDLAGSQFTDRSFIYRFETLDYGNVVENYTLRFVKQEGELLYFEHRDLKTGVDGEAIFTKNLDLCVLGNMRFNPCAPYLAFPMTVGAKVGGNFASTIAEFERAGKVVRQEDMVLPQPIGRVPAWRIETYLFNKTTTPPGASSPGIRLAEVIHYCAQPIGVICSRVLRSIRTNTVVTHHQLAEIKRVAPQASADMSQTTKQ